jgi:sugar lactone lactonase YvrE
MVTTLAGSALSQGTTDGPGSTARFNFPFDVAASPSGIIYVSDTGNHTIRAISPAGSVTTLAGSPGTSGSADGTGSAARFNEPAGIALGPQGQLYVADRGNGTIRIVTAGGSVSTLAGSAGLFGQSDGAGPSARFSRFNGIDVDSSGNIWIADTNNATIRKVTPNGVVSTVAGIPGDSAPVDGVGSSARFSFPYQLAVDSADNVYVADGDSTIRMIKPGRVVSTPIGVANSNGCQDGVGTASRLHAPQGIAVDNSGRLLVADTGNSVIRRVTTR